MAGIDLGGGHIVLAGLAGALLHSDDGGRTFRTEALPDRKANVALLADSADATGVVLVGEGGARRLEKTP